MEPSRIEEIRRRVSYPPSDARASVADRRWVADNVVIELLDALQASEAARAEAVAERDEARAGSKIAWCPACRMPHPIHKAECAIAVIAQERDQARSDLAAARESAKSMNRRCQEAESKAAATREAVRAELLAESESRAPGRPMGRMLANFTTEQLRSDLAAAREERDGARIDAAEHRSTLVRAAQGLLTATCRLEEVERQRDEAATLLGQLTFKYPDISDSSDEHASCIKWPKPTAVLDVLLRAHLAAKVGS